MNALERRAWILNAVVVRASEKMVAEGADPHDFLIKEADRQVQLAHEAASMDSDLSENMLLKVEMQKNNFLNGKVVQVGWS